MAHFNLDDYETVEERIKRFYQQHEDGRITTQCIKAGEGGTWLFKAYVYLTSGDQANEIPKATGYASETEGGKQSEWKAELGETSAIGRALANAGFSGNKRASREEMQKVANADRDWLAEAIAMTTIEQLRNLYAVARAQNAPAEVLERLKEYGESLTAQSKPAGIDGSVPTGNKRK